MLKIEQLQYSDDGKKITYKYSCSANIAKYFHVKDPFFVSYDIDVTKVPKSIAMIPFLANVVPIAWFTGFDIEVEELDATFHQSLLKLKEEFSKFFPQIKKDIKLHVGKLVQNTIEGNEQALLFSGGLDSFESLTRNIKQKPYLISVLGADIEISDKKRWNDFMKFNNEEEIIDQNKLCYVTANLRTFYTYEVDILANLSWWGKIQHGMALISLIAPLSYLHKITTIKIASSNTSEVHFGWGSTAETDEKVQWANQKVIHDGFQFKRTEKIQNLVDFTKNTGMYPKLRVCYSELRDGYNCNKCAKCQRTMLGLILCGENPNKYGFEVPSNFYELILNNFKANVKMTVGVKYEWACLQQKGTQISNPFIIENKEKEKISINEFLNLNLDKIISTASKEISNSTIKKYIIKTKYPKLFKLYLKIRRKF